MKSDEPLPLFRTLVRLLTFRLSGEEFARLDLRFALIGLVGTWLVGMGRYWDSPTASYAQKAGLGSVVYVFALSAFLFVLGIPLMPRNWSYRSVFTFITLTSFPAALYAIPVERWVAIDVAIQMNVWFLAIVAGHRVALYLFYMRRSADLSPYVALVAALLPITLIITFLVFSGYSGLVLDIMGGFRERSKTAQDGVNSILNTITFSSCISLPVLALAYCGAIRARQHAS